MMVNVSSGPLTLIIFSALFLILMKWPRRHGVIIENSHVGVLARIGAVYIDLFVVMLSIWPFLSIIMLITEFVATGHWQWSFERDAFKPRDIGMIAALLCSFYCFFYYFKWHFLNQKQTVGQHLLKFKLISSGEDPSMGIRMITAWAVLAWWPLWPWTLFGKRQDYFWDSASRIKARYVSGR